jgi:hypothetical protein
LEMLKGKLVIFRGISIKEELKPWNNI